jgi:cytochrome b pre-mRNA-processing protein 3
MSHPHSTYTASTVHTVSPVPRGATTNQPPTTNHSTVQKTESRFGKDSLSSSFFFSLSPSLLSSLYFIFFSVYMNIVHTKRSVLLLLLFIPISNMKASNLISQHSRRHLFVKNQGKNYYPSSLSLVLPRSNVAQKLHLFSTGTGTTAAAATSAGTGSYSSSPWNFVQNLINRYSISSQQHRIRLANHLFRAAQYQALDPQWYGIQKVQPDFGPQHAMLSMHVWFLHRRLIAPHGKGLTNNAIESSSIATATSATATSATATTTAKHEYNLMVQEELFDFFWNDTRSRIRSAGVHELTVNKHLKDAQQATFLQCTQYDHAFAEFRDEPEKRFELVCDAVWRHVLGGSQDVNDDLIRRLGAYVEYQLDNIVYKLPDDYFDEGRIAWGNIPDFTALHGLNVGQDDDVNDVNDDDDDDDDKEEESLAQQSQSQSPQPRQPQSQSQPQPHPLKSTNAQSGLEFLDNHWVQVLTDAGEAYYWNMETNQTTWQKPTF